MYEYSPDQSKLCHLRLNSTLTKSLLISNWYKIDTEILWDDPFDSIWLKLFTVIVYLVEIMSSIIMLAFVVYETNGLAGHYRHSSISTVSNSSIFDLPGFIILSYFPPL